MSRRAEWLLAGAVSLAAVVLIVVPYFAAASMVRGSAVFSGFLINPTDGFTYLAKMRQGAEGAWLIHLPYAAQPGAGALLFVYQMVLGHIAAVLHTPLLTTYHAARVLSALAMYLAAFAFYEWVLPVRRARWTAFLLTLFASGLGWLGIPSGLLASDLWIPESIPFLSAYTNAHFPAAEACLLATVTVVAGVRWPTRRRLIVALALGFLLGAIQPFVVLSSGFCLVVWIAWEARRHGRLSSVRAALRSHSAIVQPTAAYLVGAAPWIVYDLIIIRINPALSSWNAQNQTPSPPLFEYVLGFGLVLLLAVVGALAHQLHKDRNGRLLIAWAVGTALLLYAPFSLQRRLSLGLFFPLAALAAHGLEAIDERWNLFRPALALTLVLSLPSNLFVVLAGLDGVSRLEPSVVLTQQESDAYHWVDANVAPGSLILAGPSAGNRLPAFADVRVIYGHPFETPHSLDERAWIAAQYAWSGTSQQGLESLGSRGVGYVYFGPEEMALGTPTWLDDLPLLFEEGDISIRRVSGP